MSLLYLGADHLQKITIDWTELINCVEQTVRIVDSGDYAQPLKPYLRYGNPRNRIIAMPAYVGGSISAVGMKWIASFPGNNSIGLPRAHSVTILNDADSGQPYAIVNAPLPSAARTAAVSGLMLRYYLANRPTSGLRFGIIGWGPIGRSHYKMIGEIYGDLIEKILLYDIRGIDPSSIDNMFRSRTEIASSWAQLYKESDIIITCTVSDHRYIDRPPAPGNLLLDVSLRDYTFNAIKDIRTIIIDDWHEVCRENTDIELLHLKRGLLEDDAHSLADVVCRNAFAAFTPDEAILFCPMGMAVFDMAVADFFVRKSEKLGIGDRLT